MYSWKIWLSLFSSNPASPIEEVSTLRGPDCNIPLGQLPQEIPLKGLSNDRQWHLFEQIREFCTTIEVADLTCPEPSCPKSNHQQSLDIEPRNKSRQRLSSVCHRPGHNKRSCTEKSHTKSVTVLELYLTHTLMYAYGVFVSLYLSLVRFK